MNTYAAIFEADGVDVTSYAVVAETPEGAATMIDDGLWPSGADRLRIVDDQGREVFSVRRQVD